jgi:hypothetical protein
MKSAAATASRDLSVPAFVLNSAVLAFTIDIIARVI